MTLSGHGDGFRRRPSVGDKADIEPTGQEVHVAPGRVETILCTSITAPGVMDLDSIG